MRHAEFRGRGYDESVLVKDYNVIKWIGGNGYRTSNYPPSEEFLDYADQLGIVVIDECPIANARFLTNGLLRNHKTSLSELIKRDKNHPSVIMWSLASGATTDLNNTASYFEQLVGHVKTLDSSRPITAAISVDVKSDKAAQFLDIIGINLYTGWDSKLAMFDIIRDDVVSYVRAFHKVHNKPFLFMEYGADAYTGLHVMPDVVWSEEYQVSLMAEHFKAFDILREDGYLTGELLCYLIDFQEKQDYNYVDNIKMGVLTRQRQPKEAAYLLRQRYYSLAQQLDNTSLPEDILPYISSSFSASFMKIEL
uniref:Glycoside hydrolase family 2 catalytic domain-containing protein n=1 Tax=Timema douglasi TaxID=61478 RepID=A0A7R8VDA0_TIMDO|nr:unnamed protein product [Timema douglasi]